MELDELNYEGEHNASVTVSDSDSSNSDINLRDVRNLHHVVLKNKITQFYLNQNSNLIESDSDKNSDNDNHNDMFLFLKEIEKILLQYDNDIFGND